MKITIQPTGHQAGVLAAQDAVRILENTLAKKEFARIILATGASQFELLEALVQARTIDWSRVTVFHLDEYISLPITHGASFRKYLQERFINQVGSLAAVHLINGEAAVPGEECKRLNKLISEQPIDLAFVGIGENGHLAFNDPPADFDTDAPYLIVNLDTECRKQQLGEGWFHSLEEVPSRAISMSIKQIMKSEHIICCVPDQRKATAVKNCMEGKVSNLFPSSILQLHPRCTVYLDPESASLLSADTREKSFS
jgi:glucosamine-6-phosphate deaminase